MALRRWRMRIALTVSCCAFSGCALDVSNMREVGDLDFAAVHGIASKITGAAQIESEIVQRIYCDLQKAVNAANVYQNARSAGKNRLKQERLFPANWGARVALSLEVDENSAADPGVVFAPSAATRIERFNPYWSIGDLAKPSSRRSKCADLEIDYVVYNDKVAPAGSPPMIESDLGIEDWLRGAMFVNEMVPSTPQAEVKPQGTRGLSGGAKPESISIRIKFVIVATGGVTPSLKLVRVSTNTGLPTLFNAGRTGDLVITIGPNSLQTNNSHLAAQIGNVVGNGDRAAP